MEQLNLYILTAELSITSNTLPTLSIAIFSQLLTLASIKITLTLKTNIIQILTIIIVPFNLYHKLITQLIQKVREYQQLRKWKK